MPKRSGRVAGGLDDMIISLYVHGMSVRDILHHLEQVYGTRLSHETVSRITDGVLEEVRAWQTRPLDPAWAVVFLDAIVVKVRDNHAVQNKPAYLAVGIDADGEKHVLGIWVARTAPGDGAAGEGAGFWRSVTAGLRNRGVRDVLIACCDGLTGFGDAITSASGRTVVQRCVVHLVRGALRPVARRDAAEVARELRKIYTAPDADAALDALAEFPASPWATKYPLAAKVSRGCLGLLHPVPGLRARHPQAALHHQRDREPELPAAQGHQGPRPLPERRRRGQAALAGHHQHRGQARPRARRAAAAGRQALRPARTARRGTAGHGLARSAHRARHRLPGQATVRAAKKNNSKKFTHLRLQARPSRGGPVGSRGDANEVLVGLREFEGGADAGTVFLPGCGTSGSVVAEERDAAAGRGDHLGDRGVVGMGEIVAVGGDEESLAVDQRQHRHRQVGVAPVVRQLDEVDARSRLADPLRVALQRLGQHRRVRVGAEEHSLVVVLEDEGDARAVRLRAVGGVFGGEFHDRVVVERIGQRVELAIAWRRARRVAEVAGTGHEARLSRQLVSTFSPSSSASGHSVRAAPGARSPAGRCRGGRPHSARRPVRRRRWTPSG